MIARRSSGVRFGETIIGCAVGLDTHKKAWQSKQGQSRQRRVPLSHLAIWPPVVVKSLSDVTAEKLPSTVTHSKKVKGVAKIAQVEKLVGS
jgi:hypothetical protein